jgi:transcriptional regulator with XRE-family HTH domain
MKHPFDVHIGVKLRHCRCMAGMTQQQLGEKLGLKAQQIQNYETGAMRDIVAALEMPASIFFVDLARALNDTA